MIESETTALLGIVPTDKGCQVAEKLTEIEKILEA
jgi:hypothetical protein